jgi:hypothetical protein
MKSKNIFGLGLSCILLGLLPSLVVAQTQDVPSNLDVYGAVKVRDSLIVDSAVYLNPTAIPYNASLDTSLGIINGRLVRGPGGGTTYWSLQGDTLIKPTTLSNKVVIGSSAKYIVTDGNIPELTVSSSSAPVTFQMLSSLDADMSVQFKFSDALKQFHTTFQDNFGNYDTLQFFDLEKNKVTFYDTLELNNGIKWNYTADSNNTVSRYLGYDATTNKVVLSRINNPDTTTWDTGYVSASGNLVINLTTANTITKKKITGNIDSLDFTGGREGQEYLLWLKIDATGGYTLTGVDESSIITNDNISLIMPSTANRLHLYAIRKIEGQYYVEPTYNIR